MIIITNVLQLLEKKLFTLLAFSVHLVHLLGFSKINPLWLVESSPKIYSALRIAMLFACVLTFHAWILQIKVATSIFFFSFQSQDFLLHMPLGNSGSQQESVGGGRITVGAQTVPAADLNNSSPSDIACNCEACNERR